MRRTALLIAFLLALAPVHILAAIPVPSNESRASVVAVSSRPAATWKSRVHRFSTRVVARLSQFLPPALQPELIEDCVDAPKNKMANIAFYSGIAGYLGFWPLLPVALITGIVALNQIKKSGECGKNRAITGIVLGGLPVAILIVVFSWINGQ